jgi:hypothetical protein
MSAPRGASVYPFTRHRSTFILPWDAGATRELHSRVSRHALEFVMAGPVPAIHVLKCAKEVDGRNKSGHDEENVCVHPQNNLFAAWVDESSCHGP